VGNKGRVKERKGEHKWAIVVSAFKASQLHVHVKGESMGEGKDRPVPNDLHQYMDDTCMLTCPTLKAGNITPLLD
jgi:hypothetical protein